MNLRDILHRAVGVILLLGAGGSTTLHRQVWLEHAADPATALEASLGLLTFTLASLGMVLVIGGAKVRHGWTRECDRAARRREQRTRQDQPISRKSASDQRRNTSATAIDDAAFSNGRTALVAFLILQARKRAKPVEFTRPPHEHIH